MKNQVFLLYNHLILWKIRINVTRCKNISVNGFKLIFWNEMCLTFLGKWRVSSAFFDINAHWVEGIEPWYLVDNWRSSVLIRGKWNYLLDLVLYLWMLLFSINRFWKFDGLLLLSVRNINCDICNFLLSSKSII